MNVVLGKPVVEQLRQVAQDHDLYLEGSILKIISVGDDAEDVDYLNRAKLRDRERRRERLDFTRDVQRQNKELLESKEQNTVLMEQLKEEKARTEDALEAAEHALETAKKDLDYAQRKNQFELVGNIVTAALRVIIGVGVITTLMYAIALFITKDPAAVTLLGNTWSNLFGILLTNSFSIVGTIMGVKYATDQREGSSS